MCSGMHHELVVAHIVRLCNDVGDDWVVLGKKRLVVYFLPFVLLGQLGGRFFVYLGVVICWGLGWRLVGLRGLF